jgi:nitrite reductase/ring-hydroxylating ferredoxin subunit
MERRKFIKTGCHACMALSSGILIGSLASCTPKLSIAKVTQKNMKFSIAESDMSATDVKMITVRNFDYDVFLKKNSDGSYLALAMICTHAGNSLVKTGNKFYCSLHGSEFDLTGNVLKGPAEKHLVHLPVMNKNGMLEITLVNAARI